MNAIDKNSIPVVQINKFMACPASQVGLRSYVIAELLHTASAVFSISSLISDSCGIA